MRIEGWGEEQRIIGLAIGAGLFVLGVLLPAVHYDLMGAFRSGVQTGATVGTDQTLVAACRSLSEGTNLRTAVLRQLAAYGYGTGL